jgi:hypothetical protein
LTIGEGMTERKSTEHSPRIDEALAEETESLRRGAPVDARADPWRQSEGPADGEPVPDARISEAESAPAGALDAGEVERRSLLAISLRPSVFPADAERLQTVAEEERADSAVLEWLRTLPEDREFANVQDVWEALGGNTEYRVHWDVPSSGAERSDAASSTSGAPDEGSLALVTRLGAVPAQAARLATDVFATGVGFGLQAWARVNRLLRRSDPSSP